jgi:hypothetical protein
MAAVRAELARNRETYPLFDTPRLTRHIETPIRHCENGTNLDWHQPASLWIGTIEE